MPRTLLHAADPALRNALATGLDSPASQATSQLSDFLASGFGPSTAAIIHYGSHAQRSDARPESAHDFFVVVDEYRDAYRSLADRIGTSYTPSKAALLNRVLAPNVVAITESSATPPLAAKCAVLSIQDFRRACSARARDHFTQGRLFQHAQLVWTRDAPTRDIVVDSLLEARARTFYWGRAYLPPRFDVDTYCRVLLETSFGAEVRPEGPERIRALLSAQRETMVRMYAELLRSLADERILTRDGKVYTDPAPPGPLERLRVRTYFRRSKFRATLRWLKYMALYDDWQDYLLRKLERRSGVHVDLTERERRWPLIFLWPKALRYLRSRPQRRDPI
ncbi:MAG TPA: hypothetical protein VIQ60_13060 [Gemmatimonadaceae bacterium]